MILIVTAYWDNGYIGQYGFGIIDRTTNSISSTGQTLINAIFSK